MTSTIEELGACITTMLENGNKLSDLKDIIMNYTGTDWLRHVTFSNLTYHRKCVMSNEHIEIYVMSWNNNQTSQIHDHPEKGCLMKVLRGAMTEEVYKKEGDIFVCTKINMLNTGSIGYQQGKTGLHKIINTENLAATLHIYAPPRYVACCY